ncbi:cysteine hydrolase [Methylobrevis albus]|uniref:Cysteine hydrolase n=1 Tax=Methylobrevis albus TaxID=2793297 RepID=A0A931MXI9_9HYPH|nr:cysteine hydrolase [Methylobrevis albus]MBH0239138.1 cysteine hydrolase [Methylobrevis albus]
MPLAEPLGPGTVHLAIDMQRLFAEATDWHAPALAEILPNVVRLAEAMPHHTLYARFMVPPNAESATGRWRRYYERWQGVVGEAIDPALLDLVGPLAPLASPDRFVDKVGYSAFAGTDLDRRLREAGVDTVIFTGVETDVCVLASLFGAIDLGYRAILVGDALASSSDDSHDAMLTHLFPRLPEQIEIASTSEIIAAAQRAGLTRR